MTCVIDINHLAATDDVIRERELATVSPTSPAASRSWDTELMLLYESQYASLCRSAARLVGSYAAAEDVVQEAFLRYQLSTVRPASGRELSYLRSIVLNTARSVVRRRETVRKFATTIRPVDEFDRAEWLSLFGLDLILRAVSGLPARQREVVVYRVVLDCSEHETASAMSISPGAVKSHLSRAREALRADMEHWVCAEAS